MPEFKFGDVVELKSGGRKMLVLDSAGPIVLCVWLGAHGEVRDYRFDALTIVLVER